MEGKTIASKLVAYMITQVIEFYELNGGASFVDSGGV